MARPTRGQVEEIIPEASVREAFMRRPDIAPLPEGEREARWRAHREKVRGFLDFLTRAEPRHGHGREAGS